MGDITVGALWIIYLVTLVVAFLILWGILVWAKYPSWGMALCFATVLAVVALFIGSIWINWNQLSSTDQTSLAILYVVAFVLPIILMFCYILWLNKNMGGCAKSVSFEKPCDTGCKKRM